MGMNKYFRYFLFFAATGLITGMSACKKAPTDLQGGVITAITGQVSILRSGATLAITADKVQTKDGFFLPGDEMRTGADSTADLQFSGGLIMRVGQKSRIRLSGARILSGDNFNEVLLDLSQGRLFTKSERLSRTSRVAIQTPTTVAMVRGTEFLVVQEAAKSETMVQSGTVAVTDEKLNNPEIVEEGKKAQVDPSGTVDVQPLSDEDRKQLSDMSKDLHSITSDAQSRIQDILQNFEENKARIQQTIEEQKRLNESVIQEQKDRDQNLIQDQKERDRQMLEDQIRRDREEIDRIRSSTDAQRQEMQNKSQEQSDAIRSGAQGEMDQIRQNTQGQQDATRSELDRIRQNKPQTNPP